LTKTGLRRLIHFGQVSEEPAENYEAFADVIRELTGDWVNPVDCVKIQGKNRFYYDEVVFFSGDLPALEVEGGVAWALQEVSMIDRYQFDEGRVGFFYNVDELCREKHKLDLDKSYIVWYNGANSVPYTLELTDEAVDVHRLMYETNVRAVNGTPKWGSRANSAIFDNYMNGLVYMMPEMHEPEEIQKDWQVMLAVEMVAMMQTTATSFVPVIEPFIQEPADRMVVP